MPSPSRDPVLEKPTQSFGLFPQTHWSLVDRARHSGDEGAVAVEELCRLYWVPIYAYLRGRGYSKVDAEDLTQGFFEMLLQKGLFQSADEERGRLRALILVALQNYCVSQKRREQAQKRGGQGRWTFIDYEEAERQLAWSDASNDPERLYLASWARSLVDQARRKLRLAYAEAPRPELAAVLDPYIDPDGDRVPYREISERFGVKEAALRLQVFRLRHKLGDLLREEVRQTVASSEEFAGEMQWLKATMADMRS